MTLNNGDRGAQLVSGIINKRSLAVKSRLDAIHHGVERMRQLRELILAARHGDTLIQVLFTYGEGGPSLLRVRCHAFARQLPGDEESKQHVNNHKLCKEIDPYEGLLFFPGCAVGYYKNASLLTV